MSGRYEDDALLAELAEALRPTAALVEGVAARAKGAFTWRTIDDDLLTAELSFDSAQAPSATSRRADPSDAPRVLVFTTELRSVEVEVLGDRLLGQFLPPTAGTVEVEGESGVIASVEVSDLGFFAVDDVPSCSVRLRCTTATTRIVTAWVQL